MRVIAGKFRSRNLKSLAGNETRPTYDRLKETLFNVLASSGVLEGGIFVDLFAGTGSIGIEALSRGSRKAYFVENARKAAYVIRENISLLGLTSSAEVYERDAVQAIPQLAANDVVADVVFLDPPYDQQGAYEQVLRSLSRSALVSEKTVVVAEHFKRFDPGDDVGELRRYRTLKQGDSALSFYRK
jgi:16S rRNA (guanine966-N2)-methyltransferase